ncbi:MAG TPA: hypothetical protein VGQ45_13700 [Gaiellales bacterium]|jgi:hypothetical protein|nr:hypothetical protein [Gaiellales bacterium]
MRPIAAIALTALAALATTGCIGSGSAVDSSAQGTRPRTDVWITYTVPTCPPDTRCVQAPDTQKFYIVSRQLRCAPTPVKGNYTDPAAACRALADIENKQYQQQSGYGIVVECRCAVGTLAPKAVGYYQGKRHTIPLDGCSLCNLKGVKGDLAVLLPGAQG